MDENIGIRELLREILKWQKCISEKRIVFQAAHHVSAPSLKIRDKIQTKRKLAHLIDLSFTLDVSNGSGNFNFLCMCQTNIYSPLQFVVRYELLSS